MPVGCMISMGSRGGRAPVLLALCLLVSWACSDDAVSLANSCPQVTHAGPGWWADGELHVGVWIRDLETDPVDLVVTIDGGDEVVNVYGHGRVGLTSGEEFPGIPHELVFEAADLQQSDQIIFTPEDVEGCRGESVSLTVPEEGTTAGQ